MTSPQTPGTQVVWTYDPVAHTTLRFVEKVAGFISLLAKRQIMRKLLIGAAAVVAFALPAAASAAVNFTGDAGISFNGKSNLSGVNAIGPNQNVRILAEIEVTSDDDVNTICGNWTDDGLARKCVSFPEITQTGFYTVELNIDSPEGQGERDIKLELFGDDDNGEQDFNGQAGNFLDDFDANNRVVVDNSVTAGSGIDNDSTGTGGSGQSNGSGSTGGSGVSSSTLAALQSQLDQLTKLFAGLQTIVAGFAPDAICAQKPVDTLSLQTFFVGQNLMTIAEVNTGPGIFGPKTTRANNAFNLLHKCRA